MKKQDLDAVEIAQKQRHLYLLSKVKQNNTLTPTELVELRQYEQAMKSNSFLNQKSKIKKKAAKPGKRGTSKRVKKKAAKKAKKKKAKRSKPRIPISAAEVRRLGFEYSNLAEADSAARMKKPLSEILKKFPQLNDAWERGQLLKNLEVCATAIMTVTQAAKLLGFERGQKLRELLDTDSEIRDLWEQTRIHAVASAKSALAKAAKDGNQRAIAAVESFLYDEGEGRAVSINYEQLTVNQTAELFNVTRQTVYDWYTKHGLARNGDGSINLKSAIEWFAGFTKRKAAGTAMPADQLRNLKAEDKRLDLLERKRQLLKREEVIAGMYGRWQKIVAGFRNKSRELAIMIHGQTVDNIDDILNRSFDDILNEWIELPEFLHLPPEAETKFKEILLILKKEEK